MIWCPCQVWHVKWCSPSAEYNRFCPGRDSVPSGLADLERSGDSRRFVELNQMVAMLTMGTWLSSDRVWMTRYDCHAVSSAWYATGSPFELMRWTWFRKCSSHCRSASEMCAIGGPSSISQKRARSACKAVVEVLNAYANDCEVGLPPMTHPNRVFCKSGPFAWLISVWPTQSDASVGPALNNISIGAGLWNLGSASWRFLGICIVERSTGWFGTQDEIVGMIRNVKVRSYVPSMEVIVAVM